MNIELNPSYILLYSICIRTGQLPRLLEKKFKRVLCIGHARALVDYNMRMCDKPMNHTGSAVLINYSNNSRLFTNTSNLHS